MKLGQGSLVLPLLPLGEGPLSSGQAAAVGSKLPFWGLFFLGHSVGKILI